MLNILFSNPLLFLLIAVALVLSISIHEFSHAFIAYKLGDPTAKSLGRVTLNPRAHIDPTGILLLLLAGFGWGKPVPFDPRYLKNPKRDAALISLAGPFSNFVLAAVSALLIHLLPLNTLFSAFLYLLVMYNLVLGFFNLIPLHPLDGFKIVYGFLPRQLAIQWIDTQRFGVFILLLLIITDSTQYFITPLVDTSIKLLGL